MDNNTSCERCQYAVFTFFRCGVIMTKKEGTSVKKNDPYTRDDQTRFTMRINSDLLDQIKLEAEKNKRSTAKEIEFILEQHIQNLSSK